MTFFNLSSAKSLILILSLFSSAALAGSSNSVTLKPGQSAHINGVKVEVAEAEKTPLVEKECFHKDKFDRCTAYNLKYYVQGVSCVEECLDMDHFDQCRLRNRCRYDQDSGCFKKSVCKKIGNFGKCDEWEESVACG